MLKCVIFYAFAWLKMIFNSFEVTQLGGMTAFS